MDIIAVQEQLSQDGFAVDIEAIQRILSGLMNAVLTGKVKESTAPTTDKYPIGQVLRFILGDTETAPNSTFYWAKAIASYPKLEKMMSKASYQRCGAPLKEGQGISSLDIFGVVCLAVALGAIKTEESPSHTSEPSIVDQDFEIDPRIPIINGSVYVLRNKTDRILKVGFATDSDTRLSQHRSSSPFLIPIASFPVHSQKCETEAHNLLKPYRVAGTREWYQDRPEVFALLSQLFFN